MIYYIYKHTSKSTGKSYIGITINLKHRWSVHLSHTRNGSHLHFHNAIRKYGENDWNTKILCVTKDESDAYWLEKHLINEYDTVNEGYNLSEGGKRTPTLTGKNHPLFGKSRTVEVRKKISEHHANVSGNNNSNAKHICLTSPNGETFETYGNLKLFCREHKLGYSTVNRQLKQNIKPLSGSFVGWKVWIST